ncbi:hypothetical protein [Streptosporangium sp. NPDC049078]|uniref:hypothetical protein n=1 Tax=Streptosporangium sp. NPDC049078 TaxID=3155767 RepID=UPI0034455F7B
MNNPNPPLTAERRAEIHARHQALVKHSAAGDWRYDGSDAVHVFPADGREAELVATVWGEDGSDDEEKALGEWIAHSRRDVPDLLAQVADYENRITWHTTCQGCAGHLDREYAADHRAAQATKQLAAARVDAAKWEAVESIIRRAADHGSPSVDVDDLLEAAQNAVQQHVENLADQTGLRSLTTGPGGHAVDMEPPHELVVAMVEQAKQILGDAPNYTETPITLTVKAAGEVERYAFTVQRVGGLTPHEAREKAEAERDRLRHALERATLSVEHDPDSSACRERPGHQEQLSPCQQRPAEHAEDCPACEVLAVLQPEPAGEADRG